MSYWEDSRKLPDVDSFWVFWNGCVHCACDYGCKQWIKEMNTKASLLMTAMRMGFKKKLLAKIAQMSVEKANKLWLWAGMRDSKKGNESIYRDINSGA